MPRRRSPLALLALPLFAGCYSMGGFQSARLVPAGQLEAVPFWTDQRMDWKDAGIDGEDVGDDWGLKLLLPAGPRLNVGLRYDRLDFEGGSGANSLQLGFKLGLVHDRLALELPLGGYFGEGADTGESLHVLPTLVATLPLLPGISANLSARYTWFLDDGGDLLDLCAGVEGVLGRRVALRPEVGWMLAPGDDWRWFHAGLGVGLRLGVR